MNKRRLVIAAALLLAVILGTLLLKAPGSKAGKIDDILDHYSWKIPASELDEVLLTDGRLTDKSCARIDSALERCEAGSEEALRLAAYAMMRTSAGYPEETARQNLTDQIRAIDETAYYYDGIFAEIMKEAPWTTQLFYEKYNGVNSYKADGMLQCIAESSSALPLEDRLRWAMDVEAPTFTGADFLSAAVTGEDLADLYALIAGPTDPEQRSLCAQALAEQANKPEEIVPVLYQLRQGGLSLGELFPQGIRLSMDLSHLNRSTQIPEMEEPLPGDARFLIITRTEQSVKAEELDQPPDKGYSCNDRSDLSTFDTRLETGWMDQMRLDQMPASYEECQWLVVADMQYRYGGCITTLEDYATNEKEEAQHFYPVYGCLYRLVLVAREGIVPQQLISILAIDADTDQVVKQWTNTSVGTALAYYTVSPLFDAAWKNDAIQRFLDGQ